MIEGRQFLTVADALAEHAGEAFARTRIGRLYYAAWLEARGYCEQELSYSRTKMAREHIVIASLLGDIDASLSYQLRTLRAARNYADYDIQLSDVEISNLLDLALESSALIISRLDEIRKEHDGA